MIILCIETVAETMSMIFRNSSDTDTFLGIWKGSNIILFTGKVIRKFSVFGKILEKILEQSNRSI